MELKLNNEWMKLIEGMDKSNVDSFNMLADTIKNFKAGKKYRGLKTKLYISDTKKIIDHKNRPAECTEVIRFSVNDKIKILHYFQPTDRDEEKIMIHSLEIDEGVGLLIDNKTQNRFDFLYEKGEIKSVKKFAPKKEKPRLIK